MLKSFYKSTKLKHSKVDIIQTIDANASNSTPIGQMAIQDALFQSFWEVVTQSHCFDIFQLPITSFNSFNNLTSFQNAQQKFSLLKTTYRQVKVHRNEQQSKERPQESQCFKPNIVVETGWNMHDHMAISRICQQNHRPM